jgi:hypothetical protein
MLKLFDTVTLKNDDPETGVKAGTEGTIVDVLGNGKAFTVEFFDEDGNTIEASLYTEYTSAQLQKGRNSPDSNIADLICARRTQWRLERRIP